MQNILRKLKNSLKRVRRIVSFVLSDQAYFLYSKKVYEYHNLSFSQEGEDVILQRFFEGSQNGFYVDVGAHHPQRFSNTYLFYLKGWRGINIDAMPGSMKLFQRIRPKDINLELAISDSSEELLYYSFSEPALNSFSQSTVENYIGLGFSVTSQRLIKTSTLSGVLDQHLPTHQNINFLSIDVEGFDYNVLKSNNWKKYRPKLVLVELLKSDMSLEYLIASEAALFMQENHYELYAKSFNTLIFKDTLDDMDI
jgi:FkbM family methyltransferase